MLFDVHVHMFPDALAKKALDSLSATIQEPYYADGTVSGTLASLHEWGVDRAAALNIAATPHQQASVNRFAVSMLSQPALLPFGSVHPDSPDAALEVARLAEAGLRGIKLHPDYQHLSVMDERLYPVYEEAASRGLPVIFHTGFDPVSPDLQHAPSADVARLKKLFPKLTLIAAHMGGMMTPDAAEEFLLGRPVWIDTAMAPFFLTPERFETMVRRHGAENVLFGSDCPWGRSDETRRFIERTGLSDGEKERIFWKNAQELFGL